MLDKVISSEVSIEDGNLVLAKGEYVSKDHFEQRISEFEKREGYFNSAFKNELETKNTLKG